MEGSSTLKAQLQIAGSSMGLHRVPKEIQAKILAELGVDDLIVCQEVCRLWKATIQDTSSIQYKIALAASGMQDCLSGRSSIADRLRCVREYSQATWDTDEIPYRIHPAPRDSRQFYVHASDVFAYAAREGNDQRALTIYRPAAPYMGIVEKLWKIDTRNYFSTVDDIGHGSCTVDIAQDLIVLTALRENEIPRCYLLSLSRGGGHPLAAEIELAGHDTLPARMPIGEPVEDIAVVKDLIEWTVFGEQTNMYVFNWKTGGLVWSFDFQWDYGFEMPMQIYDMRCRIVDSSYVVAILATDIYLYDMGEFDPDDDTGSPPPFLCQMQLPRLATGCHPDAVECYIKRPPTWFPDCPPHFECDPDVTVLVLRYAVSMRGRGIHTVVVFIPLSTLRTLAHQDRDKVSPMVIPWEEWVDLGARVICLPPGSGWPSISTMGSRVALTFNSDSKVLLFDLHPHARIGAPLTGLDTTQVLISNCYTPDVVPIFCYAVRSTLPYRVVKKTIPRGCYGEIYLMQDEIFADAVETS